MWLTKKQLKGLVGAERLKDSPPVPTRMVSNGEYLPIAQTKAQAHVERLVLDMADSHATKAGTGRRQFLRSGIGLAASFFAMNRVRNFFAGGRRTVVAGGQTLRYRGQPVIDVQLHFMRGDYQ
jgi:hypothetical protein